jgi:elongation factor Ts
MSVSADLVRQLREVTGAGILDCRKALEETGGDVEAAVALLRGRGLAAAGKRAGREARKGLLDLYSHGDGRVGVMVEVNCETDFVARTQEFRTFAHEVALQIAAAAPRWIRPEDVPPEILEAERELARREGRQQGKPERVLDQIAEGRLAKFYQEHCLLHQPYVREDTKTVDQVLKEAIAATRENIVIRRFVRWEVAEEIE